MLTKKQAGFTIVEIIIVIVIIAVLATILIVTAGNAATRARDTKRIADMRGLQKSVELYYKFNNSYPLPAGGSSVWSGHCPSYGNYTDYITGVVPQYLNTTPVDPRYDTGNLCYLYRSNGTDYMIIAHQTMETVCGGDPSAACNSADMQAMDRPAYVQPTIAVYSPGAAAW